MQSFSGTHRLKSNISGLKDENRALIGKVQSGKLLLDKVMTDVEKLEDDVEKTAARNQQLVTRNLRLEARNKALEKVLEEAGFSTDGVWDEY